MTDRCLSEPECYKLVGPLRKIFDLLKVEPGDKQATINYFIGIIKNFSVNENTKKNGSRE